MASPSTGSVTYKNQSMNGQSRFSKLPNLPLPPLFQSPQTKKSHPMCIIFTSAEKVRRLDLNDIDLAFVLY